MTADSLSKVASLVVLRDCVVPLMDGTHVLLSVPEADAVLLPCFEDVEKLRATLKRAGVAFNQTGQVRDPQRFLAGLPQTVDGKALKVIVDLRFTDTGGVEYREIVDSL